MSVRGIFKNRMKTVRCGCGATILKVRGTDFLVQGNFFKTCGGGGPPPITDADLRNGRRRGPAVWLVR